MRPQPQMEAITAILSNRKTQAPHDGRKRMQSKKSDLPSNWVHTGVDPRLEKGGSPPTSTGEHPIGPTDGTVQDAHFHNGQRVLV
jgi:hypothetical protein